MCGKLKILTKNHIHIEDDKHNQMGHFFISLKLIILMINEALKLVQSKQDYGFIIPMYIINILMDPSIQIMKFIYYFESNVTYLQFCKIIVLGPKPKLIPKIKCTMLLEQLYCMYYNTKPKSGPKGVTLVCFHPTSKWEQRDQSQEPSVEVGTSKSSTYFSYLFSILNQV